MNNIKDILTINLEDEIKGVIDLNSQKESDIKEELDGFILTESLAKHLNDFIDEYTCGTMESGVWLSGFYGSGKSYFAKMLGFLLKNPTIVGTPMRDRFKQKVTGLANESLIISNIDKLNRFKSHVVLFDSAKSTSLFGLSYMLLANFLRSLGLMDNWIGLLEYSFLLEGRYEEFLSRIQSNTGKEWQEVRNNMNECTRSFKAAYLAMGFSEEDYNDAKNNATERRDSYDATKLKEDLARYIAIHTDTRIVFMIDEVSEAVAQHKINLLDLEGIAEALASLGRKVWTIAIAQLKLDDVINQANLSKNLLTKLRDRFRTTVDIKADEVDVIIKQRLLAKTDAARTELKNYYARNSGSISDITNIVGLNLRRTDNATTYADYYPFYEHQFRMLQYFLFGSSQMVQTKVGTRGMIISAFDVLKKEVKNDFSEHSHVTATQLCNQAELNAEEAQRVRYEQAHNALEGKDYKYVEGKRLLQTIHFLAKTEVTQTTAENITRSYVSCPEKYYDTLAEVKKALDELVANQILLLTGNQYRITNQTEQRILDDMKSYDVASYIIRGDITKKLKELPLLRGIQSITVDTIPVNFGIAREDGEPVIGAANEALKVLLHDIFVVNKADRTTYLSQVRNDSQQKKDAIFIVPRTDNANEITSLVTEIERINYIGGKTYTTDEEKSIVNKFTSELDDKNAKLTELLRQAYAEGDAVCCYNVDTVKSANFSTTIQALQKKVYDNIYFKRLSARLSETIAPKVLSDNAGSVQRTIGNAPDFAFFDTSGNFIGNNLAVTTEILAQATSFVTGKELENKLSGAPTGYSLGTIVTSVAALFRGNKLIARYNGADYNSAANTEARDIFVNSRNFGKASFKAVTQSLSVRDRNEIIDILKDDCEYRKWTGTSLSYQMNDFDVVDAIRSISRELCSKINLKIAMDDDKSRLFSGSVRAKNIFQPYCVAVSESNCISQARAFLQGQDDFVDAIERVTKDFDFIDTSLVQIEQIKEYLSDVKAELQASGADLNLITQHLDKFQQCYDTDVVRNYPAIKQAAQDVKDVYYSLFSGYANRLNILYTDLLVKADALKQKLDAYDRSWNSRIYSELDAFCRQCSSNQINSVQLGAYDITCRNCHKQLRDLIHAIEMVPQMEIKLMVWETGIVTTDPTPAQQPQPQPQPDDSTPQPQPQPKPTPAPRTRNMRGQLPTGKKTVAQYKAWLTAQLTALSQFDATDELDFNN